LRSRLDKEEEMEDAAELSVDRHLASLTLPRLARSRWPTMIDFESFTILALSPIMIGDLQSCSS
jgi:hypothetical protein